MKDLIENLVRSINTFALNIMPKNIFNILAEPYIAGHSIEEGILSVSNYQEKGRCSTIDILGETALSIEESDKYVTAYMTMIDGIHKNIHHNVASISVKPTGICGIDLETHQPLPSTPLLNRLEDIVSYAEEKDINITLDMEDSNWTDISLDVVKTLWEKGYSNLGIVLQSKLHRTKNDINDLFLSTDYKKPRVRACIGIYIESKDIAVRSKSKAKQLLIKRVEELLDLDVYVEIATHDKNTLDIIQTEILQPRINSGKLTKDRFEFQFLKGVQNAYNIESELMEKGYKVRYYMPVELNKGDGLPYMKRRLIANPGMVISGAKNFIQRLVQ